MLSLYLPHVASHFFLEYAGNETKVGFILLSHQMTHLALCPFPLLNLFLLPREYALFTVMLLNLFGRNI